MTWTPLLNGHPMGQIHGLLLINRGEGVTVSITLSLRWIALSECFKCMGG